jgi:membrane protein required for colicin V production
MNWLSILIIVVALLLGFVGLRQGIIRTVFGVAGLIGGIVLAGRYYGALAGVLSPGGAIWASVAAYAIILLATLVVAGLAGHFVAKLVSLAAFGWLDRLIGFLLGVFVGLLLSAAALAIVAKIYPGSEATIGQSAAARFLIAQLPFVLALLPKEFSSIRDFFTG